MMLKPKPKLQTVPPPPPVVYVDDTTPDDYNWLRAYLMKHARWEAIASKRSMRAGDKVTATEQWDTSQRLFRLAQAMQTIAPLPDMQEKDEHPNKKVLPRKTPMR